MAYDSCRQEARKVLSMSFHRFALSSVLGCFLFAAAFLGGAEAQTAGEKAAWKEIAQLGDGFVVWESSRTGAWRIWMRNLDGGGLRQLVPDENGRDHFCPHVSPDGKRLLYLSYPKGRNSYDKKLHGKPELHNIKVPLHLYHIETGRDRILVENARAYFEDRAAVWVSPDEFIYIGGDGHTYKMNLKTDGNLRLTSEPQKEFGMLINAPLTHATPGRPEFSPYDSNSKQISRRKHRGGCQPYFTRDGVWGYWMAGAGGPVNRIHLETGAVEAILHKNDSRLPAGRSYIYFPMISDRSDLIAFGASPNEHDHFRSDYDIFISRIDPDTLELVGEPARYTFDSKADRFPDVYLRGLELGRVEGEVPLRVEFAPTGVSKGAAWDMGDGSRLRGSSVSYTYKEAGEYEISALDGEETYRGRVKAEPRSVPYVMDASLPSKRLARVQFSEPVDLSGFKASLASGVEIESVKAVGADAAALTLREPVESADALILSGAKDLAQSPNEMEPLRIAVQPPAWPVDADAAVVSWSSGEASAGAHEMKREGAVKEGWDGSLEFLGGSARFPTAASALLKACRASGEASIEAVFRTDRLDQSGPARIVTFSSTASSRNFTLGQQNEQLILRLRTSETTAENGGYREFTLFPLKAYETVHVVAAYRDGQLTAYRDGEKAFQTTALKGDLKAWTDHYFLLGDEAEGNRRWNGVVEAFAVHSRALSADEARRSWRDFKALRERRFAENPTPWPANRAGLQFIWQTDKADNLIDNSACVVKPTGKGRLTGAYAMALSGGAFLADESAAKRLLDAAKRTNQLTIEAFIQTDSMNQDGPARIVTFSSGASSRNFTLGQEGGRLILRLRTPSTGTNGYNPQTPLFDLPKNSPVHVSITYRPGLLICYRDGVEVLRSTNVRGGFENWEEQRLLFGDEWGGGRDWSGRLEGVALYSRWMDAAEARQNSEAYWRLYESRESIRPLEVEATLTNLSRAPTLEEIKPYREALAVYEYESARALDGSAAPSKMRVVHWVALDGETLESAQWKAGRSVRIRIEPFERNPQLESFYMSDTLEPDFNTPLYYAVDP